MQTFTQIIDIHHRALIKACAQQRPAAVFNHLEKQCLAGGLKRPVKPGRPDNHQLHAKFGSPLAAAQFHFLLGAPVTLIGVVRRIFGEAMLRSWVAAYRRIRGNNNRPPATAAMRCLQQIERAAYIVAKKLFDA